MNSRISPKLLFFYEKNFPSMRTLLFALFVCLFAAGCSPKTTAQVTPDKLAKPEPGLVGPPPAADPAGVRQAPASVSPSSPAAAPKVVQDASKFAPTANDTSLLWRITAPGTAEPSYLFGTIHIIPEEDYFMPNQVVAALNDSKRVVFEIDPREMQNPAMLMQLMTKINMRGDTSLEDLLSAEEYAEVESYFSKMGLPFFIFKRMKPLFLSSMVGQEMPEGGAGGLGGGGGLGRVSSFNSASSIPSLTAPRPICFTRPSCPTVQVKEARPATNSTRWSKSTAARP